MYVLNTFIIVFMVFSLLTCNESISARWMGRIPEDVFKSILHYKPAKQELTPLDRNIVTPLGCVVARRIVPDWISPNAVSLAGGGFALVAGILTVTGAVMRTPEYCFAGAILILAYMVADVTDGALARQRGQGSPLGAMVDHLVDACVMGLWSVVGTILMIDVEQYPWVVFGSCLVCLAWFLEQWGEHQGLPLDDRGVVELEVAVALISALPYLVDVDIYSRLFSVPYFSVDLPVGLFVAYCMMVGLFIKMNLTVFLVLKSSRSIVGLQQLLTPAIHVVFSVVIQQCGHANHKLVMATSLSGMTLLMMKMRAAVCIKATFPNWHPELMPHWALTILLRCGVKLDMWILALTAVYELVVLGYMWFDAVSRGCQTLRIPFLKVRKM